MNWKGKKVLVTGGAGQIGAALVRILLQEGATVRIVDDLSRGSLEYLKDERRNYILDIKRDFLKLDLRNYNDCLSSMRDTEVVFHLAAVIGAVDYVFQNEPLVFRSNMLINTNVLAAAREVGVERLLYAGTSCSYPQEKQNDPNCPPLKEEDIYPANPESAYGWSKLMGEYEALLYRKYFGLNLCILRLYNTYGPFSDISPERANVIPALIRKAIRYPEEPFVVWGDGNQTRAFVYVDDIVRAMMIGIDKGMNKDPIQIGTDRRHSIREVAEKIVAVSGKRIPIVYDTSKPVGDLGRAADWSMAKRVLGWEPLVPLEKGLELTYRWVEGVLGKAPSRARS